MWYKILNQKSKSLAFQKWRKQYNHFYLVSTALHCCLWMKNTCRHAKIPLLSKRSGLVHNSSHTNLWQIGGLGLGVEYSRVEWFSTSCDFRKATRFCRSGIFYNTKIDEFCGARGKVSIFKKSQITFFTIYFSINALFTLSTSRKRNTDIFTPTLRKE